MIDARSSDISVNHVKERLLYSLQKNEVEVALRIQNQMWTNSCRVVLSDQLCERIAAVDFSMQKGPLNYICFPVLPSNSSPFRTLIKHTRPLYSLKPKGF